MSFSGVVKSFNQQKGWGFIECEETHSLYGKDIFVLKSALPGGNAQPGQVANFDVVEGDNGPQAGNIELHPAAGARPRAGIATPTPKAHAGAYRAKAAEARYQGVVKSFNAQKGWGFIECEDTFESYGKDMFVMKGALPGGDISKGEAVTFTVVQTPSGPQAQDVKLVGRPRPSAPMPGASKAPPMGSGSAGQAPDHIGEVKSVSAEKGWGFVTSPTLVQLYGKDIFFQTKDLYFPIREGDRVAFSIASGNKGPVATNLQPFQTGPPMGAWGPWAMMPPSRPPAMPSMGGRVAAVRAPPAAAANGDRRYVGTIKSINPEKAWGHITCQAATDAYGKDVFLQRSDVEAHGLEAGMLVSFRITQAAKGPQASDIMPLPEGSVGVEGQDGGVYEGTVKSFNAEKGWGFVTSPEVQSIFGKDIFLHKRELGDDVPKGGTPIQFSVAQGASGQLEAKNVILHGGPSGGAPPVVGAVKRYGQTVRASPY